VRGVLREHGLPHVTDRVLPSSIDADLAAEHADRIGPLLQGQPSTAQRDVYVELLQGAGRDRGLRQRPDQGGSTYLAARVNEAKDVLLRRNR
jgi:hypothetical protein